MLNIYKRLSQHKLVRYIFIGGVAYIIELTILFSLVGGLKLGSTVSVAISFWGGFVISFFLQKILTFKDTAKEKKRLAKQAFAYAALVGINYIFTLLFVEFFNPLIGLFIARTTALIITTLWNFFIYSKIIFKNKASDILR